MATMLRSRELVPLVSPGRSWDKRLLEIGVDYLNFAPRCKKEQRSGA